MSQRQILDKGKDFFGGNENDLGAFSDSNFSKLEKIFNINATRLNTENSPKTLNTPKESIFIICFWKNKSDKVHWVRLLGADKETVYLMDPASLATPETISLEKFRSWWQRPYLVKLL